MTYPNQLCQSHKSCSLPAIIPGFYKGERRFELELIGKLVYRKLQRIISFWCCFYHLSFLDNGFCVLYSRWHISLRGTVESELLLQTFLESIKSLKL